MGVTLKPPSSANASCASNIELNVERVGYTVNNEIIHNRTGTEEGRAYQVLSGQIQMNITGVCIEENGNTAMENFEILECATNNWNKDAGTGNVCNYPKVNWQIGDEYMLIQKVTVIDEAGIDAEEISFVMTLYIDTRVC